MKKAGETGKNYTVYHGALYEEISPAGFRFIKTRSGRLIRINTARTFRRIARGVPLPRREAPEAPVVAIAMPRPRARRRARRSHAAGGAARDDGGGDDGGGSDPPPPTPLAVLIAWAEARALLWHAGELNLTDAIDELEAEAEVSGLLAAIGEDEVQAIIATSFAAEPAAAHGWTKEADGWAKAAAEYHAARGKRTLVVEKPKHVRDGRRP